MKVSRVWIAAAVIAGLAAVSIAIFGMPMLSPAVQSSTAIDLAVADIDWAAETAELLPKLAEHEAALQASEASFGGQEQQSNTRALAAPEASGDPRIDFLKAALMCGEKFAGEQDQHLQRISNEFIGTPEVFKLVQREVDLARDPAGMITTELEETTFESPFSEFGYVRAGRDRNNIIYMQCAGERDCLGFVRASDGYIGAESFWRLQVCDLETSLLVGRALADFAGLSCETDGGGDQVCGER